MVDNRVSDKKVLNKVKKTKWEDKEVLVKVEKMKGSLYQKKYTERSVDF